MKGMMSDRGSGDTLSHGQLFTRSKSKGPCVTVDVPLNQPWHLIEQHRFKINRSETTLECPRAMGDDMYDLIYKCLIRGDLPIPALHKVLHNNGDDRVELQVDFIAARQGW